VIDRVKQVLNKPRVAPTAARAPQPTAAVAAAPAAANANRVGGKTIAFGKPPSAVPGPAPIARPQPAAAPAFVQPNAAPAFAPQAVAAKPVPASVASVATAASADMESKLSNLGLSAEQVAAVLSLSREVVERVVWEVVPDLAETLIKEEIRRLTAS
jgi:hypothetical protein